MAGAVTRWDPFAEIADVRRRFDRLFDELGRHARGPWVPAVARDTATAASGESSTGAADLTAG